MGLRRFGRVVALGGTFLVLLAACDRGHDVSIMTATPICPIAANAGTAIGVVTAFNAHSVALTTPTNASVVVHYLAHTHFNQVAPLTGPLQAGMRVQALVQSSGSGIPTALTVIQQSDDNPQTTCTASRGSVPGVVGTVAAVLASSQEFILTDAQGKQYLLALTAATSLTQIISVTTNDIAIGERVLVSGTTHGSSIDASQILILTTTPNSNTN